MPKFSRLLRRFYLTKWAPQAKNLRFQGATKELYFTKWARRSRKIQFQSATTDLLSYKKYKRAAGEKIAVSGRYKGIYLTKWARHRRNILQFQGATKVILSYKVSAPQAGKYSFRALQRYFTFQNEHTAGEKIWIHNGIDIRKSILKISYFRAIILTFDDQMT